MKFFKLIRHVSRKPLGVILFKVIQLALAYLLSATGGWIRLSKRAQMASTSLNNVRDTRTAILSSTPAVLISVNGHDAVRDFAVKFPSKAERHILRGHAIAERKFAILNEPVPDAGPWPWDKDWRYGKNWPSGVTYNFYESRQEPYDVKFPWELARLSFLIPLVQAAYLEQNATLLNSAFNVFADWKSKNPLAASVCWVPMEASMRAINLAVIFEMLLHKSNSHTKIAHLFSSLLLESLIEHGEFIWRKREYTDNPGNHYTANLVSLLILGALLRDVYRPARKWFRLGQRGILQEIRRQYTSDGVNFEKSVAYHRLVTELFLLGSLVMDNCGTPLAADAKEKLLRAATYTLACRRPDGLSVNAGDNDDAEAISFDDYAPRDHSTLIALAGEYFHDQSLKSVRHSDSIAVPWLLGRLAEPNIPTDEYCERVFFQQGGVAVWRKNNHHLWLDVGEVGQNGLGGHGHNDSGSFELSVDREAIIVDPGTYLYTGDLEARDWFRSTKAHNSLVVDDEEIAPLLGPWRIADNATPFNVLFEDADGIFRVSASHQGYHRLSDPVTHTRTAEILDPDFSLEIRDFLNCCNRHKITRYLHFPPSAEIKCRRQNNECRVVVGKVSIQILWDALSEGEVELGWVSDAYGQRVNAPVLKLTTWIEGDSSVCMSIVKKRRF